MSANASTNGAKTALLLVASCRAVSHDEKPPTAQAGSAAATAATSPRTWAAVPALANRYSISAWAGAPAQRSAPSSAGSTQASAVLVIELAMPTTVSCGLPGAVVTLMVVPRPGRKPKPSDSTI